MKKYTIGTVTPAIAAGSSKGDIDIPLNKMIRRLDLHLAGTITTVTGGGTVLEDAPGSLLSSIVITGTHHGRGSRTRPKGKHTPVGINGVMLSHLNRYEHGVATPETPPSGVAATTAYTFSGHYIIDFEPWPKGPASWKTWLNTFDYADLKLEIVFGGESGLLSGGPGDGVLSGLSVQVEAVYGDPAVIRDADLPTLPAMVLSVNRKAVTGASSDFRVPVACGGALKTLLLYAFDNSLQDGAQVTDVALKLDLTKDGQFESTFLLCQAENVMQRHITSEAGSFIQDWDEDGDLNALPDLIGNKTAELKCTVVAPAGTAYVELLQRSMEIPAPAAAA